MCDAVVDLSTLEKTGLFGRPSGHVELLEVNDGTRVAIKKIKVRPLTEEDILKELNHENVIKLLDIKWKDDSKFLILEYYERKLQDYCVENTSHLPPLNEPRILLQIANGLHYIHSKKIVHANVTIENVLLTKENTAKISGFEFSKATEDDGSFLFDYRSRSNDAFHAPEIRQWLYELEESSNLSILDSASRKLTNKIDLFSTGCTFFVFLAKGLHPFGQTIVTIPSNILNGKQCNERALSAEHYAAAMIQCMVRRAPEERVNIDVVVGYLEFVLDPRSQKPSNWSDFWYKRYMPSASEMTCDTNNKLGNKENKKIKGQVFPGTLQGKQIAVKRFLRSDLAKGTLYPFKTLMELEHPNVLRLLSVNHDDDFTFVGMELCAASLRDYYHEWYTGPVPSEEDALLQMTEGLSYLHSRNLVHGAIRPTNILISGTSPAVLKLSDFGLRKLDVMTNSSSSGDGKFSKEFYCAPELLCKLDQNPQETVDLPDAACDVFALGCVFYTYLTKGGHPFHETGKSIFFINPNIIKGCIIMQGLNADRWEKELIKAMIQDRKTRLNLGEELETMVLCNTYTSKDGTVIQWGSKYVGKGAFGYVYPGIFNGSDVAVKHIINPSACDIETLRRECNEMKGLCHPNVLNVMEFIEATSPTRYFVIMELCRDINLGEYVTQRNFCEFEFDMPNYIEVMLQITRGLIYIHDHQLVHRDIKPSNILLSYDDPVKVKIGDFGSVKPMNDDMYHLSNYVGTVIYHAPEMIDTLIRLEDESRGKFMQFPELLKLKEDRFDKTIDIFAAGCTFYYFLSGGRHPFANEGNGSMAIENIRQRQRPTPVEDYEKLVAKEKPDLYSALEIALKMVAFKRDERIPLAEVALRLLELSRKREFMTDLAWHKNSRQGKSGETIVKVTDYAGERIAVKRFLFDNDHLDQRIDNAALKDLKHPNLVSIIEIVVRPRFMYVGMEHCAGNLHDYFNQQYAGPKLEKDDEALRQLSEGLSFIHSKGYVHGELRPCNILIHVHDKRAQLKLSEFGISRFDVSIEYRRLYYAPELFRFEEGNNDIKPDWGCDVFAMGCLFHNYLTKEACHPFRGEDESVHNIPGNIISGRLNTNAIRKLQVKWHQELIESMIRTEPERRIPITEVVSKIRENLDSNAFTNA